MSNIAPYTFEGVSVRALEIDGEPWFVGKDIASALGYANPQKAVRDHCKAYRPVGVNDSFTPSLDPQTVLVNEPDMLRLIVNSTLPAAERFERWVFEEVLPSIRKTGSYTHKAEAKPRVSERYREAAAIAQASIKLCKLMGVEPNMARVITADLVHKEAGVDCTPMLGGNIAVAEVPVIPSKLGEPLGLSGKKVNALLVEAGLQTRQADGSYVLTEAGKAVGVMEPFKSPHSEHVGHRPMWYASALEPIRAILAARSNVVTMPGVA